MVVVMRERATEDEIQNVVSHLVDMGYDVHRSTGALRTVIGAVGGSRQGDPRLLEYAITRSAAHHGAVQACQPHVQARRHCHHDRRPAHRRRRVRRHGGSLRGRDRAQVLATAEAVRRPAPRSCAAARSSRAPRRLLSGTRRGGPAAAARGADAHHLPVVTEVMDASQIELVPRRHASGRRAEHAELPAAARTRQAAEAGAAEARHRGDDRRVAARGRLHPAGGNADVVLCERGVRTFEATRATRSTSRRCRW